MTRARRVRRALVVLGALLLAVAAVAWTEPWFAFSVVEWLTPRIVYRVPTTAPLVALSFDDGPSPDHTPVFLDVLQKHGAHATFFLVGDRARADPDVVERIRAGGHEVGNHYFSLGTTRRHSDEDFRRYLLETERYAVGSPGTELEFAL